MRKVTIAIVAMLFLIACTSTQTNDTMIRNQIVDASCGQCQFGMKPPGSCDLAVRIDGKSYFVDGASIDDFGDAHAQDGFCQAVRSAVVTGTIKDGRFHATEITVQPSE